MKMPADTHIILTPSKLNYWVITGIMSPIVIIFPIAFAVQGRFFETLVSGNMWVGYLGGYGILITICWYMHAQRVTLSNDIIAQRFFYWFIYKHKKFSYDEIDYWLVDGWTLVIVKKGGTPPKLPHSPFEDLSKVMLLPIPMFSDGCQKVMKMLREKQIREETGQ